MEETRKELSLVRGLPAEVAETADGNLALTYEDPSSDRIVHGLFDLVVLSIGMEPAEGAGRISRLLGLETDQSGFFKGRVPLESTLTNVEGIFLAGACENPRNIMDSIAHAREASEQVLTYLLGSEVRVKC